MNNYLANRILEISRALFVPSGDNFHLTFVVRKGKILKIGRNKGNTHPRNLRLNYISDEGIDFRREVGVHSELRAVLNLGEDDCRKFTFVNVRFEKGGKVAMSRPCRGCRHLFEQVGYKNVYFTNNQGEFEKL